MLKRVINFRLATVVCLSFLPMYACSNGDGDDGSFSTFGSFSTTQTTTLTTAGSTMDAEDEESGDPETTGEETPGDGDSETTGDGDGDGDGDPSGDGDGEPGDGDGDDTDCPPGEFGCPCINGQCAPGLTCDQNNTCGLGGGDGDGDGDPTGDGDGDPWDPATCAMPSIPVGITDIPGELCSAPCTVDGDCPAGPVNTQPACLLVFDMMPDPTNCVLICDPLNDTCSPGASCKDVPDQPGVGVCTYP